VANKATTETKKEVNKEADNLAGKKEEPQNAVKSLSR
jgi:hypothetical protein